MDDLIEQYTKVPPGQRYLAALAVAGIAVVLYYSIYYQDQQDRLSSLNSRLRTEETKRNEKEAYINNLSQYEARFKQLQEELEHARNILPDKENVPELIAQLGSRARQSGLEIEQFKPVSTTPVGFYEEIAFTMNLKGSYHEIATFVDAVGKMDRIVNVSGLSLLRPKTINQKIVLDGKFTIKTYRFISEPQSTPNNKKKKRRRKS